MTATSASREVARAADQAARRCCCVELQKPLVLEAGAGTGKTAVLVSRILAFSLGPGWVRATEDLGAAVNDESVAASVLERIVAFTFTERAAGEMAERVGEWLAALAADRVPAAMVPPQDLPAMPPPVERARRARALSSALEHLSVGTIHGYCRRLLAAHPLAARRHPSRDEVDAAGRRVAALVDEVLGEALPRVYGDPGEEPFIELAAAGVGPNELAAALRELVEAAVPVDALTADPFAPERVATAVRTLQAPLGQLVDALATALHGARERHLARALAALAEGQVLLEELGAAATAEALQASCAAASTLRERVTKWSAGHLLATEERALGVQGSVVVASSRVLAPVLALQERLDVARLRAALQVLPPLLAEVQQRLQSRGVTTFSALLGDALQLLRGDRALCTRVRAGIAQLLVDEFQDTDPTQSELIRLLALDGDRATRPGLMVVGDPKQSIYGWRGADLAAYEDFVAHVEADGGLRLALTVNYRSAAPILAEVERMLGPVMRAEPGLQPAFAPLLPRQALGDGDDRGYEQAGRAAVEYWVVGLERTAAPAEVPPDELGDRELGDRERSDRELDDRERSDRERGEESVTARRAREIEAAALAAELLELHQQGALRWGDVALLLRTTTHQETYLRALRRSGIPFLVERDRSYYRRREVIEASALLRTVVAPGDPIALLTVLRSALVGLPDAALLPLWREGLPALADALGDETRDVAELDLALEQAIGRAAAALPTDVPGIERIAAWPLALMATLRSVGRLRRGLRDERIDRWMVQLREELPLELLEAGRFLGVHRLANLERFFADAEAALVSGVDAVALSRELRNDVLSAREEQEAPVGDETLDAVRVLTIHRAKGLTFEHLYLLGTHGQPRGRSSEANEWCWLSDPGGGAGGNWEGALCGAPTLGFHRVIEHRQQVALAEEVRTLYVAATRPRQRLVIGGRWPQGGRAAAAGSHVALLMQRPGVAQTLQALRAATDGEHVDADGVRWRALAAGVELLPWSPGGQAGLPTTTEARAEVAELAQRRMLAAARQARPLAAAVVAVAVASAEEAPEEGSDGAPWVPLARLAGPAGPAMAAGQLSFFDEAVPPVPPSPAAATPAAATEQQADRESRGRIARAAGSAVHRALEELDPTRGLTAQLERVLTALPGWIRLDDPAERASASETAGTLLERLPASRCWRRLVALGPAILGREVPVLLTPLGEAGPTGVLIGSVDLLYRDPQDGSVVVVEFKTDRVPRDGVAARAQQHLPQGAIYQRAVQRALRLPAPPRLELWFLWADRIYSGPAASSS